MFCRCQINTNQRTILMYIMNMNGSINGNRFGKSFAFSSRSAKRMSLPELQMANAASPGNDLVSLFVKIGLSDEKAKETAKNKKIAPLLEKAIHHVTISL